MTAAPCVVYSMDMADNTGIDHPVNDALVPAERTPKGTFAHGNTFGRGPTKANFNFRTLARQYGPEALDFAVSVMRGEVEGARCFDRLKAADMIIDRAYGKPAISLEVGPQRAAADISMLDTSERERLKEAAFTVAMATVKDAMSDEVLDVEAEEVIE